MNDFNETLGSPRILWSHRSAEALQDILGSEELYHALWATAPDAIAISDHDAVVLGVNSAYLELYGYSAEEVLDQNFAIIFPPEQREQANESYRAVFSGPVPVPTYETWIVRKDGSRRFVHCRVAILESGGRRRAMLSMIRDLTERKLLEEQQQDFIAIAAHELKTPLTSLKGFAQLMRRKGTYDEDAIETIIRQVDRLDGLVTQLLQASRLEADQLELSRSSLDIIELASQCVANARAFGNQHNIELNMPEGPLYGWWDGQRLTQVFENLLGNASKYSSDGSDIAVSVEDRGNHVRIAVRDSGVGISSETLSRLFDRFFRVQDESSGPEGLGLGLYITRSIVEAHGGRIWAESQGKGHGSTFVFTLPLTGSENLAPGDEA